MKKIFLAIVMSFGFASALNAAPVISNVYYTTNGGLVTVTWTTDVMSTTQVSYMYLGASVWT
ncbi:MAG TPA: hypothetical protein DCP51_00560, partial [Clostridiales bacterium]|nr:hypothetical protein [Clostridiales bacterium]